MEKDTVLGEVEHGRTQAKRKKKKSKKIWINILIFILSVGFWGAAAYYGYTYAKNYIDISIKNVQQENALNVQQLTDQISLLNQEIKNLRDSIEDADSSLSYSAKVQRRIDKKLEDLDEQLEELEKSLEILKEAPDVQN